MLRKLMELDEVKMPAYLEASSIRSCGFYERLGFKRLTACISLPGGTSMFPMWRSLSGDGNGSTKGTGAE